MQLDEKKKIGKQSVFLLLEKIVLGLLSLFTVVYTARKLGAETFSILSYLLSVIAFLVAFSYMGLDVFVGRETSYHLSINKSKIKKIFLTSIKLVLISSSILTIGLIALSDFLPFSSQVRLMSPYLILTVFFSLSIIELTMLREIISKVILNIIYTALLVVFMILFLTSGFGLTGAILAYQISTLIAIFLAAIVLFKYFKNIATQKNIDIKNMFKTSSKYFVSTVIQTFAYNINVFLLTFFAVTIGIQQVGFYSLGYKIAAFIGICLQFIPEAITPAIIQSHGEKNLKKLKLLFKNEMTYTFLLVFPIMFTLVSTADVIILQFFKSEYADAIPVLQILSIFAATSVLMEIVKSLIVTKANFKYYFYIELFPAILTLLISVALIPVFKSVGAAVSFVLTTTIVALYFYKKMVKEFRFKLPKSLIKEFIFSTLFLVLFLAPRELYILVPFGIVLFIIYLMLLNLTKTINLKRILETILKI